MWLSWNKQHSLLSDCFFFSSVLTNKLRWHHLGVKRHGWLIMYALWAVVCKISRLFDLGLSVKNTTSWYDVLNWILGFWLVRLSTIKKYAYTLIYIKQFSKARSYIGSVMSVFKLNSYSNVPKNTNSILLWIQYTSSTLQRNSVKELLFLTSDIYYKKNILIKIFRRTTIKVTCESIRFYFFFALVSPAEKKKKVQCGFSHND